MHTICLKLNAMFLFFIITCYCFLCESCCPSDRQMTTNDPKPPGRPLFEPTSPYYLKNSDNTTSFPLIDKLESGNNYYSWNREFRMQIIVKRKLG